MTSIGSIIFLFFIGLVYVHSLAHCLLTYDKFLPTWPHPLPITVNILDVWSSFLSNVIVIHFIVVPSGSLARSLQTYNTPFLFLSGQLLKDVRQPETSNWIINCNIKELIHILLAFTTFRGSFYFFSEKAIKVAVSVETMTNVPKIP